MQMFHPARTASYGPLRLSEAFNPFVYFIGSRDRWLLTHFEITGKRWITKGNPNKPNQIISNCQSTGEQQIVIPLSFKQLSIQYLF